MFELIGIVCIFLVLTWVCHKAAGWCNRTAKQLEARQRKDQLYKDALLESTEGIRSAVTPETEPEPTGSERLLRANQELLEREKVRESIYKELDIE
jgi:hypothetical protein